MTWLQEQGLKKLHAQHIGGGFDHPFGRLKLTPALHGSGLPGGRDGGNPAGFLLELEGRRIYHACDTGLFSDMALIGEGGLDLAILPIGDNFTMGPDDALAGGEVAASAPRRPDPLQHLRRDQAGPARVRRPGRGRDRRDLCRARAGREPEPVAVTAARRLLWLVLFAIGFGWVEAAVVVYLRAIVYPDGFVLPLQPIAPRLAAVEVAREVATLLMLAAVAMLTGRTRWQRFAAFLVAFGVWDLVYYAGLYAALGWPASLGDWDVLFLLPWPWLGPVYAPVSAAALMVICGILVMRREERRPACRGDRTAWLLGAAGAVVLLFSWLRDLDASLRGAPPQPYPVALLLLGDALLIACAARFLRANASRP